VGDQLLVKARLVKANNQQVKHSTD